MNENKKVVIAIAVIMGSLLLLILIGLLQKDLSKQNDYNDDNSGNITYNGKYTTDYEKAFEGEGKKVLEKQAVIQPNETVRYTLNIWIDENAPVDIIGKYVYLNYGVSGVVEDGEAVLSDN